VDGRLLGLISEVIANAGKPIQPEVAMYPNTKHEFHAFLHSPYFRQMSFQQYLQKQINNEQPATRGESRGQDQTDGGRNPDQ
jgi:hypothetical protein